MASPTPPCESRFRCRLRHHYRRVDLAGLSAPVPRASRILSCASSLSSTLNFHVAKSCFLSGITMSGGRGRSGRNRVANHRNSRLAESVPAPPAPSSLSGNTAAAAQSIAPSVKIPCQNPISCSSFYSLSRNSSSCSCCSSPRSRSPESRPRAQLPARVPNALPKYGCRNFPGWDVTLNLYPASNAMVLDPALRDT